MNRLEYVRFLVAFADALKKPGKWAEVQPPPQAVNLLLAVAKFRGSLPFAGRMLWEPALNAVIGELRKLATAIYVSSDSPASTVPTDPPANMMTDVLAALSEDPNIGSMEEAARVVASERGHDASDDVIASMVLLMSPPQDPQLTAGVWEIARRVSTIGRGENGPLWYKGQM